MFNIHSLDALSPKGLSLLPSPHFNFVDSISEADALLVRSTTLHHIELPERIRAIARAGVGTDNIPIDALAKKGVPVFYAPGANANAVKELVIAAMIMSYRHLDQARGFLNSLDTTEEKLLHQQVEKQKKQFSGEEISGKTLAVLGLGNIGVKVANAAYHLGMQVIAYDPSMRIENALALAPGIKKVEQLSQLYAKADILSLHLPLMDSTKDIINSKSCAQLKKGCLLLNFSRQGIVNEKAILDALEQSHIRAYITDFPSVALQQHSRVLAFPHLGASTKEAEENCARAACLYLKEYLLTGKISHSVNFPDIDLPLTQSQHIKRFFIANTNTPGMIAHLTQSLSESGHNIEQMINQSQDSIACNLIDIASNTDNHQEILSDLQKIKGVLRALPIPTHLAYDNATFL